MKRGSEHDARESTKTIGDPDEMPEGHRKERGSNNPKREWGMPQYNV